MASRGHELVGVLESLTQKILQFQRLIAFGFLEYHHSRMRDRRCQFGGKVEKPS